MGCSASKSTNTILVSKRLTPDKILISPRKESQTLPTRFVESCLVIWLDEEKSDPYPSEKSFLRSVVYQFQSFDQRDRCLSFMKTIHDERIF